MQTALTDDLILNSFHEIIDVRSPGEFAEDHLPGAINLPVLNDAERARVGAIYKQDSVFEARKVGAALVSSNIATHLGEHLRDKPGGYRPLIYCWRGGQRSRSMALVLDQVGWPVTLLAGGYKAFRNKVLVDLRSLPSRFEYRVLSGLTGTGKTQMLKILSARGEQVLDLEGLANHQGSLLGEPPAGQNLSQKCFDTRLWSAFETMDPARPVWTEAESAKIGQVFCPKALIEMLRTSLRIEVQVPMGDRVRFLNARYQHWHDDRAALLGKLKWLKTRHGDAEIATWTRLAEADDWHAFVQRLLEVHYDPAYRSALDNATGGSREICADDLLGAGCEAAVDKLLAMQMK